MEWLSKDIGNCLSCYARDDTYSFHYDICSEHLEQFRKDLERKRGSGCKCGSHLVMVCPHCHEYTGQPWVSVDDHLPKAGEMVLAWDTQRIYICHMPDEEEYNEHWIIAPEKADWMWGITGPITHWMPLPKPPSK